MSTAHLTIVRLPCSVAQNFLDQIEQLKPVADARWENYWGYQEEDVSNGGPYNSRCFPDTYSNAKCNVL